ncbi:3'-5' exonuclease [Phytohabitans aurantiacus]|uniref:DNA polymerase III subunit epsilon n=1 Tax=Phytohabitans aurantiacus TaxID=3016789 RepID=A0ABQ5QYX3_9ACTN|nr:exonuclease domain-containing protein [Phytohabitans aurantiacus]GLH99758.1 DNA polymerase III subunit epsilon [Phytohabitans aurantiacus]
MTARLSTPDPRTPWREAEFCVLDLETTGLDLRRDEIISYGAVIVRHARIPCGDVVYRQVRPSRPVSASAVTVHGLRAADLADAPPIDDVLNDLIGLLSGRLLVAHAAWVERAFLDRALRSRGRRLGRLVVDTAALLRAARLADSATGREPSLEAAAQRLGLPVHTPHHALGDAFTTAELLLVLATRMERTTRPLRLRDLYRVSQHHSA